MLCVNSINDNLEISLKQGALRSAAPSTDDATPSATPSSTYPSTPMESRSPISPKYSYHSIFSPENVISRVRGSPRGQVTASNH